MFLYLTRLYRKNSSELVILHNWQVEFDDEGKACGVTSEGETAKCKKVVCDPSYLTNKVLRSLIC